MKHVLTSLIGLIALALIAATTSCTVTNQTGPNPLVAAGFKVITPNTPAQVAKLKALPTGRATAIKKSGKTYYVFPDVPNNRAYVGGPKQYRAYLQTQQANNVRIEDLQSEETSQETGFGWDMWSGWDANFDNGLY